MKYFLVALVVLFAGGAFYYAFNKEEERLPLVNNIILIGETEIPVEIADTEEERIKGLSGRESLPEGHGLLFVSDYEGIQGIWMKDMNFPIDIAWLDKNKKIIDIKSNVTPDSYPQVFYPEKEGEKLLSSYVLETNSGFFEKSGIKIGDSSEF